MIVARLQSIHKCALCASSQAIIAHEVHFLGASTKGIRGRGIDFAKATI